MLFSTGSRLHLEKPCHHASNKLCLHMSAVLSTFQIEQAACSLMQQAVSVASTPHHNP